MTTQRLPPTTQQLDLATLITLAEMRAPDGHVTIMRFTTHWKCCFGTPDLRGGEGAGEVEKLAGYPTLQEALVALLRQ